MRFDQILSLNEERGSGSFDYKYWFWAKKGSTYGLGYARQDVEVDIRRVGSEAADAVIEIKSVLDAIDAEKKDELEVVEKKIRSNTKRIEGIADLFSSPIVIHWLTDEKPKVVEIPQSAPGDVTDSSGRRIDVVDLFTDAKTREFVTHVIDWDKVNIDDSQETINTITAKFIKKVFVDGIDKKKVRTIARSMVSDVMTNLSFEKDGVEVKSFKESDYKLLPKELVGSKKIVTALKDIKENNFKQLLDTVRKRF